MSGHGNYKEINKDDDNGREEEEKIAVEKKKDESIGSGREEEYNDYSDDSVSETLSETESFSEDDDFSDDEPEDKDKTDDENEEVEIENKEKTEEENKADEIKDEDKPKEENKVNEIEDKEKPKEDNKKAEIKNEDKPKEEIKNDENGKKEPEGKKEVKENKKKEKKKTREDTIKRELVLKHLEDKNAKKNNEPGALPEPGESKGSKIKKGAKKALTYTLKGANILSDVINVGTGVANSMMGMSEAFASNEPVGGNNADTSSADTPSTDTPSGATDSSTGADAQTPTQPTEKQILQKQHQPYRYGTAAASIFTGGIGMVTSGIGTLKGALGMKSKNKRTKWSSLFGAAAGASGLLANAAKITGGGLVFGDQTKQKTNRATNWMGFIGAAAGLAGSMASLGGSITDKVYRKRLISQSRKMSEETSDNEIANAREALADSDEETYANNKRKLKNLKAQKYAMKQAAEMNTAKGSATPKGIVGTLGGILSVASAFTGIIPGWKDSVAAQAVKAAGGLISTMTTIGKNFERITDERNEARLKVKKKEVVDEYIEDKMERISGEIKDFQNNNPDLGLITENEKRRIVVGRLGLDVPIEDEDISSAGYDQVFDIITHRRAVNIMGADKAVRAKMLAALKLDENASLKDIESVLKGE